MVPAEVVSKKRPISHNIRNRCSQFDVRHKCHGSRAGADSLEKAVLAAVSERRRRLMTIRHFGRLTSVQLHIRARPVRSPLGRRQNADKPPRNRPSYRCADWRISC